MSVSDRRNPSYEAECPICAEPFVEARQLPCEHVYCLECLERWVSDELDQPARLTCPTCGEQFQLPENGVQELPAPVSREPDFDDEDLETGSFEMVPVAWTLDNQTTSGGEEAEPSADAQTGDHHNAGDVTDDDVINRNVRVISTGGDEDTPTGSVQLVLDNEVGMNSPEDRHDNDQGDERAQVRAMKQVESSVGAVTALDDELYVALYDSRQIHVYRCDDLHLLRCLPITDLGAQVYGLAACPSKRRLYISDWDNDLLHAVALETTHDDDDDDDADPPAEDSRWAVANQPAGLSLAQANVLVACHGAGKIQEWSPEGTLIRQIQLADECRLVWHCIQLNADELAISHEGSQHRVVVVSADDGQPVRSSCGRVDEVQLQYPRTLAVDRERGRLLVADQCNNRIITLDHENITDVSQLEVDHNQGLAWPYGLHMDENRRRLYVVEWNHGRILRVDLP